MNPILDSYIQWVRGTTETICSDSLTHASIKSLISSAENAYIFAKNGGDSLESISDFGVLSKLALESRYLAVLLGSRMFDAELGGAYAYTGSPLAGSLFDAGLGWLPLFVLVGGRQDSSAVSANNLAALECYIPSIDFNLSLGSTAACILSLDDLKRLAFREIENHAKCSHEELLEFLNKTSVEGWEFAIADAGCSLLMAEGLW